MGLSKELFGYKRPYRVGNQAAANSAYADNKHTITVKQEATLEKLDFRIYPGAELALRIQVFIQRSQTGALEPILKLEGKDYIDGDDDKFSFDISIPVYTNDQVVIQAKNTDATYAYDYSVDFVIDYLGGIERLIYGRRR